MNEYRVLPGTRGRALPSLAVMIIIAGGCGNSETATSQATQNEAVDFGGALIAEVLDTRSQVVLRGRFTASDDDDALQREARLSPTGIDADASGEVEIVTTRSGATRRQELEFSVANLQPVTVFTFVVDGRTIATVRADGRGRAKHERTTFLPLASAPPP